MASETLINLVRSDLTSNKGVVTVREAQHPVSNLVLALGLKDERAKQIPVESYAFCVAPSNAIAPDDVENLNRFLDGITSQEPAGLKPYSMYRGRLRVGRLYFQETILTQRVERSVELFDPETAKRVGLLSPNLFGAEARKKARLSQRSLTGVDERHFVRDIHVFPFPSVELAKLHLAHDEDVLRKEQALPPYERDRLKSNLYWELRDLMDEVRPRRIQAIKSGQSPFPEIGKIPELQELLQR